MESGATAMRHFCDIFDLSASETQQLVAMALRLKQERAAGKPLRCCEGRVLGLLFEKPSMRTRVSFEAAFAHLGGSTIFLSAQEVGLGRRESVADVARIISQYVDLLAARTFSHEAIVELAAHASCPVVNALSDFAHPCQALGDLCTVLELFHHLEDIKIAFVGDGNNVARSLAASSAYCGLEFVLSAPRGYEFTDELMAQYNRPEHRGRVRLEPDPLEAVRDADVIYADVWTSMGQEAENAARLKVFRKYQINSTLMARAKPSARFFHCLPARRGEEVTADVIDGPQSEVVCQAANRLHAQKALMVWLLEQAHSSPKP